MKNSALIIKVPTGSSFEETVKVIQESGVNPDDFGATVTGMRKTKGATLSWTWAKAESLERQPPR